MANQTYQAPDVILHKAQETIVSDPHRFRVVCAGRRTGKTIMAVEEIKAFALLRGGRIAYIAPTFGQTRDLAWEPLLKTLSGCIRSKNEARLEIKVESPVNPEGAFIVLRGWEAIETLRGQKFNFIIMDEVAMMSNFSSKWQEIVRPTLVDYKGQCLFLSTPKGYNHFFDLFEKEKTDTDFKSFKFSTYSNPHIPVEELEKAKNELTENRFAQEFLADFRKVEGVIYPEFDRSVHLFDDSLKYEKVETIAGIDWGYTDPTAMVIIDRDREDNFYIRHEYYKTAKTTDEIAQVLGTYRPNKVYPDSAEPDRAETLRRMGFNVQEVNKDVNAGIDSVRSFLKNRKLFIHKECTDVIFEFENYAYGVKDGKPTEKPDHEYSHSQDAIRYCLHAQSFKMHSSKSGTYIPTFLRNQKR